MSLLRIATQDRDHRVEAKPGSGVRALSGRHTHTPAAVVVGSARCRRARITPTSCIWYITASRRCLFLFPPHPHIYHGSIRSPRRPGGQAQGARHQRTVRQVCAHGAWIAPSPRDAGCAQRALCLGVVSLHGPPRPEGNPSRSLPTRRTEPASSTQRAVQRQRVRRPRTRADAHLPEMQQRCAGRSRLR